MAGELIKYGSYELIVPPKMVGVDKKGNKKIYNVLTKKKQLTSHNGVIAIKLDSVPKNTQTIYPKNDFYDYQPAYAKRGRKEGSKNRPKM